MSGGSTTEDVDSSWKMSPEAREKLGEVWGQLNTLWDESGEGGWFNQQIAGLNQNQVEGLDQLASSEYLRNFAYGVQRQGSELTQQGAEALAGLGNLTQEDIFYDTQKRLDTYNIDERTEALFGRAERQGAAAANSIYGQAAGQGNVGSSRTSLAASQAATTANLQAAQSASALEAQARDNAFSGVQQGYNIRQSLAQQQLSQGQQLSQIGVNAQSQAIQNQLQAGGFSQQFNQYGLDVQRQNQQGAFQQPWANFGQYSQLAYPLLGLYAQEGTGTGQQQKQKSFVGGNFGGGFGGLF